MISWLWQRENTLFLKNWIFVSFYHLTEIFSFHNLCKMSPVKYFSLLNVIYCQLDPGNLAPLRYSLLNVIDCQLDPGNLALLRYSRRSALCHFESEVKKSLSKLVENFYKNNVLECFFSSGRITSATIFSPSAGNSFVIKKSRTFNGYLKTVCHKIAVRKHLGLGIPSSVFWANRSFFAKNEQIFDLLKKTSDSLIFGERPERFAHITHFWWAT